MHDGAAAWPAAQQVYMQGREGTQEAFEHLRVVQRESLEWLLDWPMVLSGCLMP